jgi:diaminohydroxyphosphoribosylaminopyrimidine deaminase/5-amino-6-(5-phosphoribosylamino)uracil reductase
MSIPSSTDSHASHDSTDGVRDRDRARIERALALAAQGIGLAHPNPIVGAVVEKNEVIVGEGFHQYDLRDHAEVVALRAAGDQSRGATMYVTLEPCCHTGRTGPCTQAILNAGISRVVVAMLDPNPKVAGQGVAQLRKAGVHVTVGIGESEAREANADFAKWILTRKPLVTLKSAMSLDGRIAEKPGANTAITGPESRQAVQQLRHRADAILTGIGTVLTDDPLLTDRSGKPRRRKLLRVVADSKLRIPLKSKLVKTADHDLLVLTTQPPTSAKARALTRAGAEVLRVRSVRGRVDLSAALAELGKREILGALLEAGAEMNGASLEAGIVDRAVLYYAPRILGEGGVPFARIAAKDARRVPQLLNQRCIQLGSDFMIEGWLRDVYGNHRTRRKN